MIVCGDRKKATTIDLSLKSVNTRFRCFTEPLCGVGDAELSEPNTVTIIFDDTREIETFINLLERFRDRNNAYIGRWNDVKGD